MIVTIEVCNSFENPNILHGYLTLKSHEKNSRFYFAKKDGEESEVEKLLNLLGKKLSEDVKETKVTRYKGEFLQEVLHEKEVCSKWMVDSRYWDEVVRSARERVSH